MFSKYIVKRHIYLTCFVIWFCFLLPEFSQNQVKAQTKTLEFAGSVMMEMGTIYLTRHTDNSYAYGLVGAMLGVIVVDKVFIHEGGSVPRLITGTAVGAFLGATAAIIIISRHQLNESGGISNTRELIAAILLLGGPAFGATIGYNPAQKDRHSLLYFEDNRFSLGLPLPLYKTTDNNKFVQKIEVIQIKLLNVSF